MSRQNYRILSVEHSKNGQAVWLSSNGVPNFNNDNKLTGFRGTTLDIITDKIIEGALSESEEHFG